MLSYGLKLGTEEPKIIEFYKTEMTKYDSYANNLSRYMSEKGKTSSTPVRSTSTTQSSEPLQQLTSNNGTPDAPRSHPLTSDKASPLHASPRRDSDSASKENSLVSLAVLSEAAQAEKVMALVGNKRGLDYSTAAPAAPDAPFASKRPKC